MAIRGLKSHQQRLKNLQSPATIKLITGAIFSAAEMIAVEAQLSITRGAVSGKGHVASKKGEAPNNEFGTLAGSIEAVRFGKLKARVQATAEHAVPLEFGATVKNGFGKGLEFTIEERPFMRPARDKKKGEARDIVVKASNVALKRARGNGQ
jgi:hypothetical protein